MKKTLLILFLTLTLTFIVSCKEEEPYTFVQVPVIEPQENVTLSTRQVTSPNEALSDLSVDLLKLSFSKEENTLVSPLSVSLALGMTAGGADTETLEEFERVLGRGVSLSTMNEFYKSLSKRLNEERDVKIGVANSIWIRDNESAITPNDTFLSFTKDYFNAEVRFAPFNSKTITDINSWVSDKTDEMIKKVIDEIDPLTIMYLINALSFDAEWQREYTDTNPNFKFINSNGEYESVTGLVSKESKYIEDENATGFIKNYKGGNYSFAVILPNEDVPLEEYLASIDGEKLQDLLDNASVESVNTVLPKFSFEFSANLNEILKAMGLEKGFSSSDADFSKMGESSYGNIYIGNVIHKTFIEVGEKGTRAAAVTVVEMDAESAMPIEKPKQVIVNRPFIFAIIDNTENLPLFIGTVLSTQ